MSYNTTTTALQGISGVSSQFSTSGTIVIVGVLSAMIAGAFTLAALDIKKFERLYEFIKWLKETFSYFLYGVAGVLTLGVPASIAYWMTTTKGGQATAVYLLYTILGYFAIALLGIPVKWVSQRISEKWQEVTR